jgi:hypothetical protein
VTLVNRSTTQEHTVALALKNQVAAKATARFLVAKDANPEATTLEEREERLETMHESALLKLPRCSIVVVAFAGL